MTRANPRLGIVCKLAAVAGFTLMSALVKLASESVPTGQLCFFRSFFALLTIIVWLSWRGEFPSAIYTSNPKGHFWRGSVAVISMVCNFSALGLLPLPDAIALGYTTPLFLTIFAALILGEAVHSFRWTAIGVGMLGVLIILWPRLDFLKGGGSSMESLGALYAMIGAATGALGAALASRLVVGERSSTIVFYFSAMCSFFFALTLPFEWRTPSLGTFGVLVVIGILGGISQVLVTESYRHAEASTVAPFEYTSMLFGILLGLVLFGDLPTATMLIGSAIVIASGLIVIWREHALRIRRLAAPAASWPWAIIGADEHEG